MAKICTTYKFLTKSKEYVFDLGVHGQSVPIWPPNIYFRPVCDTSSIRGDQGMWKLYVGL